MFTQHKESILKILFAVRCLPCAKLSFAVRLRFFDAESLGVQDAFSAYVKYHFPFLIHPPLPIFKTQLMQLLSMGNRYQRSDSKPCEIYH